MRRPAPLLPAPAARLIGFVLLAGLGALQWRRMAEALSVPRALLWVAAAVAAVALLLAAARHRRAALTGAAVAAGTALAVAVSGIELRLLAPGRWDELAEGLGRGAEALGGVRLPYRGADPWPAETLELSGALLVLLAAYLAFWPRGGRHGSRPAALTLLLVLIAAPVLAMSVPAPLVLGAAAAALTACFLFLERLPGRPGLGAAALGAAALAIALPLGAAADREEPWFDYRSFAEALGPVEPVSFAWDHAYGPIDWPRDGRELFRVRSATPLYWKAETLDGFDRDRWLAGGGDLDGESPWVDLAPGYDERGRWDRSVEVTLRRLQTRTLVGPGTILDLREPPGGADAEWIAGRWLVSRELGRGDSYTVAAHVPQPTPEQLRAASPDLSGRHSDSLTLTLGLREDARDGVPELPRPPGFRRRPVEEVTLEFPPLGIESPPSAHYAIVDISQSDGRDALRRTGYRRSWRLASRLRRESDGPWDYVQRVNAHLRLNPYRYTERPPAPPPGVPPLEHFIHSSRAGYCQQFSGAMALLLRMGGVPARVAAGFTPGGYRSRRGEWVVRDVDAHSWVEAWFEDIGWVTLDPTPPATPARSQTAALDVPEYLRETGAPAAPAAAGADPPARRPEGLTREPVAGATAAADEGVPWALALGLLAAAGGAAAAALVLRRRECAYAGIDGDLAELERALRRSGRPPPAGVTLAELERRLGGSDYLRALRASRYGARPSPPTRAQRAQFRRELAAGLGLGGRLRALWALPPRLPGRSTFR